MKFLKISSLLVLSLLLFVPAALAEVECTIGTSLQEIRMESMNEKVAGLMVTCEWDLADEIGAVTAPANGTGTAADTAATGAMFNLELDFNGMVAMDPNDEDQMPTLWLMDLDGETTPTATANAEATGADKITTVDDNGNRYPAPAGEVSGSSILWADVVFPASWGVGDAEGSGSFAIDMLYLDATSVDDDRLDGTIVLTGTGIDTEHEATVARVKQALDLELGNEQDAGEFDACDPDSEVISVNIMEGFRKAWRAGNDIMLMTSSGSISVDDDDTPVNALDVTDEGSGDTLIVDVSGATNSKDDSDELKIKFAPEMGGSGNITLSAMLLPMRRTDESFMKSAELIVGSFEACSGDGLFFPFVTSMSGWDTGIVVVNDSEVDGSCSLNWGNMDLDDDEMDALSTVDVDAKDHTAFLVSAERGADYSGSVGVACTFSGATGYVFLSDSANGIGQGYLVNP